MKRFVFLALAYFVATNAQAADLGGDCCTDLEQKIEELEKMILNKQ